MNLRTFCVSDAIPCLFSLLGLLVLTTGCAGAPKPRTAPPQTTEILDAARDRRIPVTLYFDASSTIAKRELVVIDAGYRAQSTDYSFLAQALAARGYAVVCIQHEIPSDPPSPSTGDLYTLRKPIWERGVKDVQAVVTDIRKTHPNARVEKLALIGHSNGGDIRMLYSTLYPDQVTHAITLDHRRMPVPRVSTPKILSIRADEFEADPGVLPSQEERARYGISVVTLANTKHADLSDMGSEAMKARVVTEVVRFLQR